MEWICGYANAKGGKIYIGVNDDGYVVGLKDTRYLLDKLPNQVVDTMGIVIEVDYGTVNSIGENLKYNSVPADIAMKPENLYIRASCILQTKCNRELTEKDTSIKLNHY